MRFDLPEAGIVEVETPKVILVGYSGRDPDAIRAHVAELAEQGVPAPDTIPSMWEVPGELLSQSRVIDAPATGTSGEAEPVLLFTPGGVFVTVGSDHTDRDLERTAMERAKVAFPKIVARRCWPLGSVRAIWDRLVLRSEIRVGGAWRVYQEARLDHLLPPEWFLERFSGDGPAAVLCGTVPTLDGVHTNADGFRALLRDPESRREISLSYRIGRPATSNDRRSE